MTVYEKFEDLPVWKLAKDLAVRIYENFLDLPESRVGKPLRLASQAIKAWLRERRSPCFMNLEQH